MAAILLFLGYLTTRAPCLFGLSRLFRLFGLFATSAAAATHSEEALNPT